MSDTVQPQVEVLRKLAPVREALLATLLERLSLQGGKVMEREEKTILSLLVLGDVVLLSAVLLHFVDRMEELTGEVAGLKGRIAKFEERGV
ncbi:MAG: hypothetical protein WC551_09240 [Patescibacteria group bacterium]